MLTVKDIVKKAGGATAVAKATGKSRKPVTPDAVWAWFRTGVHNDHWDLLISLAAARGETVTVQDLHDANKRLSRKRDHRRRSRGAAAAA